ncbi:MAG: Mov34/MPN/PAD-1 family protein [Candidatus Brocadiales bacterium]
MLRLNKESTEAIKKQARESYPYECGGFLAGKNASGKEIMAVYPMKNLNSHQPRLRFEIDPKEFQRIETEASRKGLQLLVFYHSHPDTPLRTNPSAFDRERAEGLSAFWPDLSYLIVSVDKGKEFQLASWVFNPAQGAFEEEKIEEV